MIHRRTRRLLVTLVAALTLAAGILAGTPALAADDAPRPAIAFDARLVGDETRARLVIDLDRRSEHQVFTLDRPRRLVVEFQNIFFALPDWPDRASPFVETMRFGAAGEGKGRLVLSLARPVRIEDATMRSVDGGTRHRLIVDLLPEEPEAFAEAARRSDSGHGGVSNTRHAEAPHVVVLDPGHGGIDGGASAAGGVREKDVTLAFARSVASLFADEPRYAVKLTRDSDRFMRLNERVEVAREAKADLFISIHADSLRQKRVRGATVYLLSRKGSDDIARQLANEQNRADMLAGFDVAKDDKAGDILIDMMRDETRRHSRRFASLLVTTLEDEVRLIGNPLRGADFFVLKAPDVPSVLLELGYLSNGKDAELLSSDAWRARAAGLVRQAITGFFDRVGDRSATADTRTQAERP